MKVTVDELRDWLEKNQITREEIAERCGVKRNAVNGWFYRGEIPKTAGVIIRKMMNEERIPSKEEAKRPLNVISLELTPDQFEEWSRAALVEQKIITEWIINVADDAAQEYYQEQATNRFRAAEDEEVYAAVPTRDELRERLERDFVPPTAEEVKKALHAAKGEGKGKY